MAYLKLDYSQLEKAARNSSKTAGRIRTYAEDLQRNVGDKVNGVTGGANGNTSTVASLATQKANALRKKADEYDELQKKLAKLRRSAESADKAVAAKLRADQKTAYQNLNWLDKLLVNINGFMNDAIPESEVGRFLNNMIETQRLIDRFKVNGLAIARDFFIHGKGRYLINIALGVGAAIAAVLAIAGTGGLVLVAAVVAAAVACVAAVAITIDNVTALANETDNPGYAKHMGSTDSLKSYAEKHYYDKDIQNAFGTVDRVGEIAGAFRDLGSIFATTATVKGPNGVKTTKTVYKVDWNTAKGNLLKKVGFTKSTDLNPETAIDLNTKAKSGQAYKKVVNGKTYYATPESFFKSVAGIKSNPESHSKTWTNMSSLDRSIQTGKTIIGNTNTVLKDVNSLNKQLLGKNDNYGTFKNVVRHVPIAKDVWSIGEGFFGKENTKEHLSPVFNGK